MLAAFLVLIISLFTELTKIEVLILVFTISLVIITEMLNTAIEKIVDIATEKYHPLAKIAKDVAAGAVLIAALNSLVVAYIIFFEKLNLTTYKVIIKVQQNPVHIMFIALALLIIIVISLKAYFNKGTPFQGGMPSGHAAIAFGDATAISFISKDVSVVILYAACSISCTKQG
jgi:diacylglycerol kinase (ATP)